MAGFISELQINGDPQNITQDPNCANNPLSVLIDQLTDNHNDYLRYEFPRIALLVEKVAAAHGGRQPELRELKVSVQALLSDLELHITRLEHELFPLFRKIEIEDSGNRNVRIELVEDAVRIVSIEMLHSAQMLERIRELTNAFTRPQEADNTYLVLVDSLKRLYSNVNQHFRVESQALYPEAFRLCAERNQVLAGNTVKCGEETQPRLNEMD